MINKTVLNGDNGGHEREELTAVQDRAILSLIIGSSVEDAARKTGVSDRTLHRWMNDPVFYKAYQQTRRNVIEQSTAMLAAATQLAVNTLKRNLQCGNPQIEIRAAKAILDTTYRGLELLDIEERLGDLEQRIESQITTNNDYQL